MGIAFFINGCGVLISGPIQGALLGSRNLWWRPITYSVLAMAVGMVFILGGRAELIQKRRARLRTLLKITLI
jgi:hypothetical protein